jgi:hypothetical protein
MFRPRLEPLDERCLPSFSPAMHYPISTGPQAVEVGDFNGDGKLDLATANVSNNAVSVLLGNGDGTFQPAVNSDTGNYPFSMAVGDFNGDGKLDLVTVNIGDNSVSVLLGNGNGTFQPAADIPLSDGLSLQSVAVGDFNGDGKLDLGVTANFYTPGFYGPGHWGYYGYYQGNWYPGYDTGEVHLLIGNGLGDFSDASSASLGYGHHTSAAVADFNGDGDQDFAAADLDTGTVSILTGDGAGNLQWPSDFDAGGVPLSVTAGDVNGDGKSDLVTANQAFNTVGVLLGDGQGGFAAAQTYATGGNPASVALADFNHDLKPDIATDAGLPPVA